MVAKSRDEIDPYLLLANEMEALTKAAAPNKEPYGDVEYADPGYQEDKKKRYPLDNEEHIRAAWSYVNQEKNAELYSAGDLAKVKAKIKAAMAKIGADVADEATAKASDTTIVAKIKDLLLGSAPEKEELDMGSDELKAILSENNESLAKAVAEAVSKSIAPAEGESAEEEKEVTEAPAEGTAGTSESSEEDIVKSIQEALAPYNELLEKMLDRITGIEEHFGVAARKSIDGQEDAPEGEEKVEKSAPSLEDAIAGAFRVRR